MYNIVSWCLGSPPIRVQKSGRLGLRNCLKISGVKIVLTLWWLVLVVSWDSANWHRQLLASSNRPQGQPSSLPSPSLSSHPAPLVFLTHISLSNSTVTPALCCTSSLVETGDWRGERRVVNILQPVKIFLSFCPSHSLHVLECSWFRLSHFENCPTCLIAHDKPGNKKIPLIIQSQCVFCWMFVYKI